jgi:beta-xylosidase
MADPGCILVGDAYYVCGTQRGGFEIFKSPNLRDWSSAGSTGQGTCGQCWAPNLHKFGQKYYLVFTDGNAMSTSIAVSGAVTGPYKTVGSGVVPGIDGYLFQHGGENYCFYNPIRRGPIMACATMSADWSRMTATKDLFSGPAPGLNQKQVTVEAPVCTRVGGTLFLSYSFNATGPDYNLTYATATSPLGPWAQSGKTLLPEDKTGHGHHDIVKTRGGNWACIYHGAAGARNLCIDRAIFDERAKSLRVEYSPPGKATKLFS